jgi:hypothetical protein
MHWSGNFRIRIRQPNVATAIGANVQSLAIPITQDTTKDRFVGDQPMAMEYLALHASCQPN